MDVDHAEAGQCEQVVRDQPAVGGHDTEVRLPGAQGLSDHRLAQPRRLVDGHAVFECQRLDRRVRDLLASAAWTIRLRDNTHDSVGGGEKPSQRRHGELRRTEVDDAHQARPATICRRG